jgi:pSer/pThr/pTyr-binding forkhead associated (FHA) protein
MTRQNGKKHELLDGFPGRRMGTEVVGKKASTNGIDINGVRVAARQKLQHGDKISLPDKTEIEYIFFRPSSQRTEDDTEANYPRLPENPFTDVNFGL